MDETKREREKHNYPKIEASHIKAAVRGFLIMGASVDEVADIFETTAYREEMMIMIRHIKKILKDALWKHKV